MATEIELHRRIADLTAERDALAKRVAELESKVPPAPLEGTGKLYPDGPDKGLYSTL